MPNKAFYKILDHANNNADGIKITSFKALVLIDGDNSLQFFNIENESSLRIIPQTFTRHDGKRVTTHYVVDGTFYLPQNKLDKIYSSGYIIDYLNKEITLQIIIGNYKPFREDVASKWTKYDENLPNPLSSHILTNDKDSNYGFIIEVGNTQISAEIESVEYRFRNKITFQKIILLTELTNLIKV